MEIIDISQEVLSCVVFPGDPAPKYDRIALVDNGDNCNLSQFFMCAHNGTHVDAPFHFLSNGKTIDQIPLDHFVGYCFVARHEGILTKDDALAILEKAKSVNACERILIAGKATVSEECAQVFADAKIKLIGNESQTVGPENAPKQVHLILLSKNIVLLEGVVLKGVKEGKYFLSCAPLNFAGFDGSPCRAYLIKKDD